MPQPTLDSGLSPVTAVTHPNPYPYYADLVRNRPIYFDDAINCWVAASAEAVTAVLSHDLCRVRPPSEPVPAALLGSPAGDIFAHLVRMNDGEVHRQRKPAVASTLMLADFSAVDSAARKSARILCESFNPAHHLANLSAFGFHLPVYAVGSLLGIPDSDLPLVAEWMADFVSALAPKAAAEALERGKSAAACLIELFARLMETKTDDSRLAALAHGDMPPHAVLANAVGFLSQSYEATAGLIGNTLVTLACEPDLLARVMVEPKLLPLIIAEVVRHDPPVQNTRRYLAGDGVIAGQRMQAGDTILVVLAAANRDSQANPDPNLFDPHRANRRSFTFGLGAHACPGERLAVTIAQAGVEAVLASGLDLSAITTNLRYRPSANTRIPLFGASKP